MASLSRVLPKLSPVEAGFGEGTGAAPAAGTAVMPVARGGNGGAFSYELYVTTRRDPLAESRTVGAGTQALHGSGLPREEVSRGRGAFCRGSLAGASRGSSSRGSGDSKSPL